MLAIELSVQHGRHIAKERDGDSEVITVSAVPLSDDEEFEFTWLARINELREGE